MAINSKQLVHKNESAKELQEALGRVLKSLVFHDGPPPWLAELPVSQLRCWYQIAENEGLRMHDLSLSLGVKLPAISQIVDRLVRKGLIERTSDPLDRRAVRLHLTEGTRVKHLESKAAHLARVAETSSRLNPAALETLISGLNNLADAAEAMNAESRHSRHGVRLAERIPGLAPKRVELEPTNSHRKVSPAIHSSGQTRGKSVAGVAASGKRNLV